MGAEAVNEDQKAIIAYVKDHFVDWMEEKNILPFPQRTDPVDPRLLERMIRVEEELKRQNEKFDHQNEKFDLQNEKFDILIANMDKRFTSLENRMNQRFTGVQNQMDQRFTAMQKQMDQRFNRQTLFQLATFTAIVGSAVAVLLRG